MSGYPALQSLKIGCVQYLNAKPLICAYPGAVVFDHPARLAEQLASGLLDVALVPTYEALRSPDYKIADSIAIASHGPVFSVVLAYRGRLQDLKTIALDPGSLTSVFLLRTILAEFHGLRPGFAAEPDGGDARLVIGNQAIAFRNTHGADCNYLDLGGEWSERTGLPFVYAMWLLRREVSKPEAVADELRELKRLGMDRLEEIACGETGFDANFCRQYLGGHVRYDLGDGEKRGIAKWRELLLKHGLIASAEKPLDYI